MIWPFNRRHHLDTTLPTAASRPGPANEPGPPAGPSLFLLAPDAAGPAGRRLHAFPDCDAAAAFVQFWFPLQHRRGLIAFWAVHEDPADGTPCEAVIMIRDPSQEGLVYPFAFRQMDGALAFLRSEARRGVDLSLVQLYRAVPIVIDVDDPCRVAFSPDSPPRSEEIPASPGPAPAAGLGERARPGALSTPLAPQPACTPHTAPRQRSWRAPHPQPAAAEHLLREAAATLRTPRWEQRREAFSTFGSPPGRF